MSRDTTMASPHFAVTEFRCHDGSRVPSAALPALRSLATHFLEPLRDEFGPVRITSGYRPKLYNRSIGSTDGSFHVYELRAAAGPALTPQGGVAADCVPARGTVADWVAWAETWRRRHPTLSRRALGGVGRYTRSGFIHLDTGPRRSWEG